MIGKMVRKSLFKNIKITAWTFVTLSISAALVAMFATVSFNIEKRMGSALRKLGPNAVAVSRSAENESPPSLTEWGTFRKVVKKESVPVAEVSLDVVTVAGTPVALATSDPQALAQMTPYWVVTRRRAQSKDECLVGKRVAELLKLKPGMSVTIDRSFGAKEATRYSIAGILVSGDENENRIFVSASSAEIIQHSFAFALLSVPDGENGIEKLNQELNDVQSKIEIKPLREIVHGEESTLKKVILLSSVSLIAVLILTVLGVSSALLSRIVERRKEFALLQAIGASKRSVVHFLFLEGTVLAISASVVGFVLGTLLSEVVVQQIFHVSVKPEMIAIPITFVVILVVSYIASSAGVVRALKMQPALVLKGE